MQDVPRQSVDFYQSGKFTFEPNVKPLQNAAEAEIIDSGVSFGGGPTFGAFNQKQGSDEYYKQGGTSKSIVRSKVDTERIKESADEEERAVV